MRTGVLFQIPSALTGFLSVRDPGGGYRVSHRHASQRRHGVVARETRFPGEPRRQLDFLAAGLVNCVCSSSSSSLSSVVGAAEVSLASLVVYNMTKGVKA